jgi:hypothetical protein
MLPFVDSSDFFRRGDDASKSDHPVSTDLDVGPSALEERERRRRGFERFVAVVVLTMGLGTALAFVLPSRVEAPQSVPLGSALRPIVVSLRGVASGRPPSTSLPPVDGGEKAPERPRPKLRRAAPVRSSAAIRQTRARPNVATVPARAPLDRPPPTARFED